METVSVNTSQNITIDYPVAGLGERVAARLLDAALFFGLYIIFIITIGLLGLKGGFGEMGMYVIIGIYAVGYTFYDLLFEIFMNGQSLGKRWLKIKVISLDGSQASIGQYFIRWLFRIIDFVLTFWLGGLICVAVTEKKQRIGDIVAGTTLIKTVPRTTLDHLAFNPVEENYIPTFLNIGHQLTDRDIELIHEVIRTYRQTHQYDLIYKMAGKIAYHLGIVIPEGMDEFTFLTTIINDYNHETSRAI